MSDSSHRILASPTGDFYVRRLAEGEIETGWCSMLEHGNSNEWRCRHFGPLDAALLPSLCDRILRSMGGERVTFDDIDLPRGTAFQRAIWRETRRIRPGLVRTYGDLAATVGRPAAARAVGQAMRRNPQPIVIPCHRVISASGPGGFGGDGADGRWSTIKATLLKAEAVDTRSRTKRHSVNLICISGCRDRGH